MPTRQLSMFCMNKIKYSCYLNQCSQILPSIGISLFKSQIKKIANSKENSNRNVPCQMTKSKAQIHQTLGKQTVVVRIYVSRLILMLLIIYRSSEMYNVYHNKLFFSPQSERPMKRIHSILFCHNL